MPTAAIFDIDGTLVDTNNQHALAWYRAFRRDQAADADALDDRVTSTSFIAALPPGECGALVGRLRTIAAAAPQPLSLGYWTEPFAYERLESARSIAGGTR